MTLISPAYTTEAAMQRRFSAAGVTAFSDHDESGTSDTGVVDDAINEATEEINLWCQNWYAPADLATSMKVERWATTLACYFLCMNRGNSPPESFVKAVEQMHEDLKRVSVGTLRIPGLPWKSDLRPSFSNETVDRRFLYRKQRVKPNSTSAPSSLGQDEVPYPAHPPVAE